MEPPLTSDIHTELKNLIRAKLLHFSWEMPTEINLSEKKSYFFFHWQKTVRFSIFIRPPNNVGARWCHVPQSHLNPIYNRVQIIFTECMIIILCHGPRHRCNYVSRAINLIQHTPNVTRLPSTIWRVETDPTGHTLPWKMETFSKWKLIIVMWMCM